MMILPHPSDEQDGTRGPLETEQPAREGLETYKVNR